jgi:hypothetical protein
MAQSGAMGLSLSQSPASVICSEQSVSGIYHSTQTSSENCPGEHHSIHTNSEAENGADEY